MKGTVICQLWPLPYKLFNEQLSVWVSDNWCLHHETDINMKAPVRYFITCSIFDFIMALSQLLNISCHLNFKKKNIYI